MKPLVSGVHAKRYINPIPTECLLFPYDITEAPGKLFSEETLAAEYPNAWRYLKSYESELRNRENGKMDIDDGWWCYVYPKNLTKHAARKLIVPRLVVNIICSVDENGTHYLDNVDVGGVAPSAGMNSYFLAGVLNGPVAGYVFRRISKPFRGDYRSANKQFIAPLPIPYATDQERADVAARARRLQELHTQRRDALDNIARRLSAAPVKRRPESFLFPDLPPAKALLDSAPKDLDSEAQRAWAKKRHEEALQARYDAVGERLRPGSSLDVTFAQGELKFLADGAAIIDRIFLTEADGEFIAAQWKVVASTFTVSEEKAGEKLCTALRKLIDTDNAALRQQVISLQAELAETEASIADDEAAMNAVLYRLYGLTKGEIAMVEKDRVAA